MQPLSNLFNAHLKQLLIESTTKFRLIVALSGGLDSVVLLHLAHQFLKNRDGIELLAHNVNHGLSENAEHWGSFCTQLCEQLGVTLIHSKVHIENRPRTSLEALARDARYQCFREKMQANDIILTGHHQDDQLETLLLALKRGSGSTGLQGIQTSQAFFEGTLLRPLLIFSRQQLTDYAKLHQLQWIEDESNQNTDFDRNFIRHEISPLLKQRWPAIAQSVSRTAQLCQEQQSLLNEIAQQDLENCQCEFFSQQTLSIAKLSLLSDARRNNVIRYWLKSNGVQYPSNKQLLALWHEVALAQVDKQPKLQLQSESIRRYQEHLFMVTTQKMQFPEQAIDWSGEKILWLVDAKLGVDFSKVESELSENFQIKCCLRQHIDSNLVCLPEGRDKSRSIKKLLHEYQVPPWLREQVIFIFINDKLVEAVGLWQCTEPTLPKLTLSLRLS
ncbi:tRNA lysidine(34) synthetase TilS [Psychromonas sp. RZ22]|uniref:tRNA lysidine(34) synthetase TilS n=1 Tax=Psychromonas algarum TaxID=2555643 RepID=UPI0010685F1F|nr:tRNA lysidine(34) synthetase TilS [Psychromonas sp. RZ22]TEW56687.1 tRNA lysidine(34) synthetase TilS [Psychromonas sp. RZ22]